jgi:hypothetical protein
MHDPDTNPLSKTHSIIQIKAFQLVPEKRHRMMCKNCRMTGKFSHWVFGSA